MVFLFFLTENDEVKQAVLSKYTLSVFYLCVGSAACFVICLLEEFIGKPHILSDVLSHERLITLICCAVTDILGSVEPNTNQEIKFRRLEES